MTPAIEFPAIDAPLLNDDTRPAEVVKLSESTSNGKILKRAEFKILPSELRIKIKEKYT
jgi:hypothetical protein